jgi:predicted  nucleic acid-binding Zn-ribbon protein
MGILEEKQAEKDRLLSQCQEEEISFHKKKEQMISENSEFDSESGKLKEEREKVSRELDSRYLNLYNKVLMHRGSPVVVKIIEGNCQGCHMTLPPQLSHDVRKGTSIITCSFCQRILYVEE